MIVLSLTTDKLQVVLGEAISASQCQCAASYRDITASTYVADRNATNSNGTTDVDLVTAPAVGSQRVIDQLTIYNADVIAHTVTIKYDLNGTEYIIRKESVSPGYQLQYADGAGFSNQQPTYTSGYPKQLGYMGF